jgi:hypothetical protein
MMAANGNVLSMKKEERVLSEKAEPVLLHILGKLPAFASLFFTMFWYCDKGQEEPGPLVQPTTGYTISLRRMRMYD